MKFTLNKVLDFIGTAGIGSFYPLAHFGYLTRGYEVLFVGCLAFACLGGRLRVWGIFAVNLWAGGWLIWTLLS